MQTFGIFNVFTLPEGERMLRVGCGLPRTTSVVLPLAGSLKRAVGCEGSRYCLFEMRFLSFHVVLLFLGREMVDGPRPNGRPDKSCGRECERQMFARAYANRIVDIWNPIYIYSISKELAQQMGGKN